MLAPTAIDMASENWALAIVGMATVIIVTMFFKGFVQVIPVLIAMIVGYLVSLAAGQVDLTAVKEAGLDRPAVLRGSQILPRRHRPGHAGMHCHHCGVLWRCGGHR